MSVIEGDYSGGRRLLDATGSAARRRILSAIDPETRARHWGALQGFPTLSEYDLARALAGAEDPTRNVVISLSHDNYVTIGGGVQNCVADEQRAFSADGWSYIHLAPRNPLPQISPTTDLSKEEYLVTVNGSNLGFCSGTELVRAWKQSAARPGKIVAIIHHLLGHSPECVHDLLARLAVDEIIVWAHDLFVHCPSVHLLRNDAIFCNNPPVGAQVCGVCVYGEHRSSHMQRIRKFFEANVPRVFAPSETILALWREADLPHKGSQALAPAKLGGPYKARSRYLPSETLKVGFLGGDAYHKGWDTFARLATWHADDLRYEFLILSASDPGLKCARWLRAEVTPNNRTAMVDAIRSAGLDLAINWSLCFESFSFTAIEALAGGSAVLARQGAGNVWPLVKSVGKNRGFAVGSELELQALFSSGEVLHRTAACDRIYSGVERSAGAYSAL